MPDVVTVDLGFRPRPWQEECLRRLKRFSVVVVHRRGGKTVQAIVKLIDAALRCQKPRPRYAYIAPELKQAKGVAWDYLRQFGLKVPGASANESELWVELPNGARIRLYGADSPDSLRGLYFDGVVLDEVAQMKPFVWGEIILPALSDRQGWALFIGTPKGMNLFSELYFRAIADPAWYAATYTIDDTHALAADELATMRANMSAQQWRQEMLCDFTASSDESLISLDLVNAAMGRALPRTAYEFAPIAVGVDVARQGADRTVIQPRQGLQAFAPIVMQGADAMHVAQRVARTWDELKADACMVDGTGGYGAGVIDRLKQLGYRPMEVQFGGSPDDERFANKRAEMWWRIKEWLEAGGALPNDTAYRIDLTAPQYDFRNAAGKLALESKDKMVARGLPSPDLGDALACTFAFPVRKPRQHPVRVVDDYAPFG